MGCIEIYRMPNVLGETTAIKYDGTLSVIMSVTKYFNN